jgi:hypothetical protein
LGAAALDELEAHAALADAGVADDADRPTVRGERRLEEPPESRELALAADEAREPAPARDVEARAERARAGELVDAYRHAHALQRRRAAIAKREEPLYQPRRVLGHADRAGRGHLLDAGREADRVAERRVLHAEIVADAAEDDLARVEAHADAEREPARRERARVVAERGHQVERGVAAAAGMVLVRDRRAEERHDAVAGELVDRALEAVDAGGQDLEEAVEDAMPLLGIDAFGQLHRVHDVGEEHRHELPLALEHAPVAPDLVREVRRRDWRRRRDGAPRARGAPQPSQKRCPAGFAVAQRGHVSRGPSPTPHSAQNAAFGRLSCRQRGHSIGKARRWFYSGRRDALKTTPKTTSESRRPRVRADAT